MNDRAFTWRVYFTAVVMVFLAVLLSLRLVHLHFSEKIFIAPPAKPPLRRGYIKDQQGRIMALSLKRPSLYANPERIREPRATARFLSVILEQDEEDIYRSLTRKRRFVWIARRITDAQRDAIEELKLPGLDFRDEYQRYYPYGEVAAHLLGFVGTEHHGLEGIEYSHDYLLSGGDIAESRALEDEIRLGKNVVVTIDATIQFLAGEVLRKAAERHNAKQAAAIVMEVGTGRILALAKWPGYNPNEYNHYTAFERRHYTVIDAYEPGSTLKVLSIASALERDAAIVSNRYECSGAVKIGDTVINCTDTHGMLSLENVIAKSCNVGVAQVMKDHPAKELHDTLVRFGFGKRACGEIPGESEGILRPLDQWSGLSKYSMAIGHEISATSLQMVGAFGAIANEGIYMVPAVIEGIQNHDGTWTQSFYPRSRGRVASKRVVLQLTHMMESVVTDGTGRRAASKWYRTAGKTGTSKKFIRGVGAYTDHVVASFIGFAPVENPDIVVLVVVDDPADRGGGGTVSAPVFREIVDRVLPYRGITSRSVLAGEIKQSRAAFPSSVPDRMPDLRGKRDYDALQMLMNIQRRYNIEYGLRGAGMVTGQEPAPGEPLQDGVKVLLQMSEE